MNIMLIGYYGYHNIGDDLFIKQLTNYLASKQKVKKNFILGEDNYYKFDSRKVFYFTNNQLSKIKRALILLKSDYIAWGGGSLELDGEPGNLLKLQKLSKLMGKGFGFLGIGLDSVLKEKNSKSKIANIFAKSDYLYLRDNYSYEMALEQLKLKQLPSLGGDLAFLDLTIYEKFFKPLNQSINITNISFSGKKWWGDSRAEFYAKQLMPLIEKYNTTIHLLPGQVVLSGQVGDQRNDNLFHELLKKYLPSTNCQIHSWKEPEDFLEILSSMNFHIGNRLHPIILADILGIPNIGIGSHRSKIFNYIHKTKTLIKERVVDFMEPISMERIMTIFDRYKKPENFILKESSTAKSCLEQIFFS